ncbi:tRNA lysidine(34) synthetase TilS [Chloroflexota bacterium]
MPADEEQPLEERVLRFIKEQHLVSGQQRLLVAVSGGADSVCLLHVLSRIAGELGVTLHVAHLNHQLRGAEADADARYVAELAQSLGIPVTIEKRDVKTYKARHRLSPEEAAREVRYTFLAEVAQSTGAGRVAVGHTTDDNIETILMHLIRGTGTRGLRGLQPLTRLKDGGLAVIRLLLPVSREETVNYCRQHRLMSRTDTSNLSLSPLRNRIRHQLLPLLGSYNPQISGAVLRTARIAADDIAFLDEYVARIWDEIVRREGDTVALDKELFCRLPSAVQQNLLRAVIESLAGDIKDIEKRHIDIIMAALDKPAGRSFNLPSGLTFTIDYDRFLIGRDAAALSPLPVLDAELTLNIPGETGLPGWRVSAEIATPSEVAESTDCYQAYLDLDKAGDQLTVRRRRAGDRFQPMGMSQLKKLNKFMIDARIPRPWRQRIPLVGSPEQIIWVVGWRIDDRVKVTGATRRVLHLRFEPLRLLKKD